MTLKEKEFWWKLLTWATPFLQDKIRLYIFGPMADSGSPALATERLNGFVQATDECRSQDDFEVECHDVLTRAKIEFGVDDLNGRPFLIHG